jgi:hypothetical protein
LLMPLLKPPALIIGAATGVALPVPALLPAAALRLVAAPIPPAPSNCCDDPAAVPYAARRMDATASYVPATTSFSDAPAATRPCVPARPHATSCDSANRYRQQLQQQL